jgi:hypothetical protein
MGKRIDILDSLYTHLSTITDDTYAPLKSEGNGAIAFFDLVDDACAHFSIQPEESSQSQGQANYFVSASVYLTAYKRYTLPVSPNDNDYEYEKIRSDMIEHLRTAYGLCTPAMCTAGLNTLDYIRELEPNTTTGDGVAIKLEFTIKWYDRRA